MTNAPHDIEIEQALLGALILQNDKLHDVADVIESRHFYEALHGEIFSAIASRVEAGQPATPMTLRSHFRDYDEINPGVSVYEYINRIAANGMIATHPRQYAEDIRRDFMRRELAEIGHRVSGAAHERESSPEEIVSDAERMLYEIASSSEDARKSVEIKTSANSALDMILAARRTGNGLAGLATGLTDLDAMLGGLQASDLVIVAGRPGMGKTALAVNMAENIATGVGNPYGECVPVGIFSMEMSDEQLALRMLASRTNLKSDDLRRGKVDDAAIEKLTRAVSEMSALPIHIDQSGGLTIDAVVSRARRMRRKHGVGLIIIDYLQLMRGTGREGRVQDITAITMGLKAMAKDLNLPVIALSQLSRQVENRDNKRPQLSDLRESGSIEQDADAVLFVYREEYYLERQKPEMRDHEAYQEWQAKMMDAHGKAEIIIGKHRHGPVGTVTMQFSAAQTKFNDLARQS